MNKVLNTKLPLGVSVREIVVSLYVLVSSLGCTLPPPILLLQSSRDPQWRNKR